LPKEKVMNGVKQFFLLFGVGLGLCIGAMASAQQATLDAGASGRETYSLRAENVQYGRVEASLDQGGHWILIGRVQRPALQMATEKAATRPGVVVRGQREGIAFSAVSGRVMKLLPALPPGKPIRSGKRTLPAPGPGPSAILTDIPVGAGPFSALLPPTGSAVRVLTGTARETPFPADYLPALEDVVVFHVQLPLPAAADGQAEAQREDAQRETVRVQMTALQQEYAAGAVARARRDRRKVVSGTLTLRATVPEGEPDPITAVTYMVDGRFIAAQDTGPFVYLWNTRNIEDGEHLLEIRAVNRNARPVTRMRVLVVVQNSPPAPAASAASAPPGPRPSP
jgi:hypothetical protein